MHSRRLPKIPFDLELINNNNNIICCNCKSNIIFKKRIESQGVNWTEPCGSCISCTRKKGCGGYEKYIDVEIDIPICNNCNTCLKCKKDIFNIYDKYEDDKDYCKINNSYLHRDCYKEYTKPKDNSHSYSWCDATNKWIKTGTYAICNSCQSKYIKHIINNPPLQCDCLLDAEKKCINVNMCIKCKEKIAEEKLKTYYASELQNMCKTVFGGRKKFTNYRKSELVNKLKKKYIETNFL